MAKYDPELAAHKKWLGLVQPVGLVVSPPALVKAQAVVDRNVVALQQTLLGMVRRPPRTDGAERDAYLDDFPTFAQRVLGWQPEDLAGGPDGPALAEDLEHVLPNHGDTLRPTFAVVDGMVDGIVDGQVLLLVKIVAPGTKLDKAPAEGSKKVARGGWQASPQARFERLLRETKTAAGLLSNGHELRLVYAPSGESSGHVTFSVKALCEVDGRLLLGALHMLLSAHRVLEAPDGRRLLDLLVESRKYQNEVSTKLSEQVLGGLWDLLAGFQAADEAVGSHLVDQTARDDPAHIYGGLLTVQMRLVFLLYAEDEGLMPDDGVYTRNYSVAGLFERLREDAGRYPDTMDQRYGAWAWLLSLFRLLFDGGGHHDAEGGGFRLPTRHGQLFNPDEYPFLEGRRQGVARVMGARIEAPRVSDGCVYRVLEALLMLDGERLSYRALDVEQIGSVYEAMMGFEVERAFGQSIAVKPKHVVFDVDQLLAVEGGKRKKWLKDRTECDVVGKSLTALKQAVRAEDVVAALGRKISPRTPRLLAPGSLYLQPGEERRRSGSHYTPRELTEPIVSTTLRPIFEHLGERPTPEQILDLKVCDPAMGSGAFLVEACRQLATHLVEAWEVHDCQPDIPPDEDPLLHARRLVAQRCLYGVDKNPFAVNLAKLSLWLVTLARDHAFTFLDHALKCGDSLVGLTREQIAAFHWDPPKKLEGPMADFFDRVDESVREARELRGKIQALDDGDYEHRKEAWRESEYALRDARLVGDLVIAAFFGADKAKAREELRLSYHSKVALWKEGSGSVAELRAIAGELRRGRQVAPFHWSVEFPEVFERKNSGFDVMVGNPPFLAGVQISGAFGKEYLDYLKSGFLASSGQADIVAYFARRTFNLLRGTGALGLVTTNTIAEGDTRAVGLLPIRLAGGSIFKARRRFRWPGGAAVHASVVHILKGEYEHFPILDGTEVDLITAYLFHRGPDKDAAHLKSNEKLGFKGQEPYADGFVFEDGNENANRLNVYEQLISNPHNSKVIYPYLNGKELNSRPDHRPTRFIIFFGNMALEKAKAWPDLLDLVEEKVKPQREQKARDVASWPWWKFWRSRPELLLATSSLTEVLAIADTSKHFSVAKVPSSYILNKTIAVVALDSDSAFAVLQSRIHEVWARFQGSSLRDDLRYTISSCFQTFPFPPRWDTSPILASAGNTYLTTRRSHLMAHGSGLTKTYNRFHNPEEHDPDILKLRDLHAAMDRAVLDAYGWTDIATDCEFLLDYEIDEETWSPRKKKPYRYRWPEDVHDEVLARLLDLNQKRYQEEVLAGLHAGKGKKGKGSSAKVKTKTNVDQAPNRPLPLFDDQPDS